MNSASLYANANSLQYGDAEDVVKEYFHLIKFSKIGGDRIMDVGCGEGKVTIDILYKRLPSNIRQLIATDVSPKMIKYAEATYSVNSVEFQILDIAGNMNDKFVNSFDHVFSFNCLHWVQNQRAALKNICRLLKFNGDTLLCFQAKNHIYDVYKNMAENPRWSSYMKDYKKYVSPYHFCKDPAQECRTLMEEAGFRHVQVETKQKLFYFYGMESLKKSVFAVSPFLEKIPANLHDRYFEDYFEEVRGLNLIDEGNNNNGDEIIIRTPYLYTICYAIK